MTTADGRPPGDGRHARPEDPDQAAQTAPAAEPAAEPGEAGPSAPAGNAALAHDTTRAVMAAVTPGLVFRWAVAATVGVFVVGLVFSGLYAVRNILVLVVIALFIAVSLDPAVRWLIRHGVRRSVAVTLIIILLLIVVTAFFVSVVPPLAGQASRLTKDLPRLRRGFVRLFPRQHRPRAAEIVNVVVDKVGGYMIGNIIISVFAGVSTFIVLVLLKVPYALPLAVAVAITDLIPFVGATLGAAICVLVALVTKDLWPTAVLVLVF